ncbi:hypothetical protein [Arundinibacter roseus]|uniref:DUF541 domain-containing protein n=1 Tax=Arundinibacter roseus TaxID=2070510 RepID=A0A4R4KDF4_9BACT|nr:hypothetical protein [Arundinibacter roseus]TDB65910.1 hypothetical protein EZE20_09080 [Arundinibacter roseus]
MKTVPLLAFLLLSLTVLGQKTSFRQEIDDNGKHLSLRVELEEKGHKIQYCHTFVVRGMSNALKKELVDRLVDSLKSELIQQRISLHVAYEQQPAGPVVAMSHASLSERLSQQPFQKSIEKDTLTGRLKVSYIYQIDGIENSYERTINTQNRSEEEIERLIEETEQEILHPIKM